MRVAVIGAAGAMGSFFARYLVARGEDVVGSDIKPAGLRGMHVARSDADAAKDADAVIVATPMGTTVKVCRTLSRHMKEGSLLVEISSVKGDTLEQLREIAAENHVKLLSVHPLFGPALQRYSGMRMAVIEDGRSKSVRVAKKLFPDARLVPMSAEAHDTLMAVMLSLTHLVNIAYAKVVSDTMRPRRFHEISTPSSALQSVLAEGVLSQDPSFCAAIQKANKNSPWVVRSMALELLKLNEMLERGDDRAFSTEFRRLAKLFSADGSSMRKVYRAYDTLAG